jgi:formate dehydrogenase maturation protein FdhE
VIIAGFLPMFFAAYAYREFNRRGSRLRQIGAAAREQTDIPQLANRSKELQQALLDAQRATRRMAH